MLTDILFELGQLVATPAALEAIAEARQEPQTFLDLHQRGEWGAVSEASCVANTLALTTGERILSIYRTAKGRELWVITEADRSSTTILLPDEY